MQIVWKYYNFNELSTELLYQILKLRQDIFIIEQFCPYDDMDNKDKLAIHLCGFVNEELVAYSRIFHKNIYYKQYASIGRIVIHNKMRGRKVGEKLMTKAINAVNNQNIKIEAQCYLEQFYNKFGFVKSSKCYSLDGILHYEMTKFF